MGNELHDFLPEDPQPGPSWARANWPLVGGGAESGVARGQAHAGGAAAGDRDVDSLKLGFGPGVGDGFAVGAGGDALGARMDELATAISASL